MSEGSHVDGSAPRTDPEGASRRGSYSFWLVAFLSYALFFGGIAWWRYEPLERAGENTYMRGDSPYYLMMAHSLLFDRDLDLKNQLLDDLETHQENVSLGLDGEWYPKHSILMAIAALPLLWLLGPPGGLVFNVICLALALLLAQRIAASFVSPGTAFAATWLLIVGSYLPSFAYTFSTDVFSTLLVLGLFAALMTRNHATSGLLSGLAVWAKLTNALFWAAAVVWIAAARNLGSAYRWAFGNLLPIAILLALNASMFGSPFRTGYDRILVLRDGKPQIHSHRSDFDAPWLKGMKNQLLDEEQGLVRRCPILILALPGLYLFVRRRPREAALLLGSSLALFLFMSPYRYWMQGWPFGTRFLLTPVMLMTVPLAFTVQAAAGWWRARRDAGSRH